MAKPNIHELIDTLFLNYRHRHWPKDNVFAAFNEPLDLTAKVRQERSTIDANRNLSPEGKLEARQAAGKVAREAVHKWHELRRAGLDADIAAHRAGLLPVAAVPDPKRVEFILG